MISITTPTFDAYGAEMLKPDTKSDYGSLDRRASRTKTLDGGVTIDDMGFSWGDVTLKMIFTNLNDVSAANLKRLTSSYSRLIASTKDGVFNVSPSRFEEKDGVVSITLLISEKLSG